RAEGSARAGVGEHVVVFGRDIRDRIHGGVAEADAGARSHAAGAITLDVQCCDGSVAFGTQLQALKGAGSVADSDVLLAAIEHEPHRRSGLARQMNCERAVIADAELRAEAAAGVLAD